MEDRISFYDLLVWQVVNVRDHNGDSVVLIMWFVFFLELGISLHREIWILKIQLTTHLRFVHYSVCILYLNTNVKKCCLISWLGIQNWWNFFQEVVITLCLLEILCMGKRNYDLFLVKKQVRTKKNGCGLDLNGEASGN